MIKQKAPLAIEMETFDANLGEYLDFVNLFRELMENWIQDSKGRLLRLQKYSKGQAHDLIKHCLKELFYTGYSNA